MDTVEEAMLFNLRLDISEKHDLADERPKILASLMNEAHKARKELGDYNIIGPGSRFFDTGPIRPKTFFP